MILSLSRTRRRCSQSDMTELDEASGPVKDRRPSDSCLVLLLKNASVRKCSIGYARELASTGRDRAAAHVPLPRITMSKSCLSARTFIMPEKQSRPQDRGHAGGVERVYREAVNRCQTGKAGLPRLFCRALRLHARIDSARAFEGARAPGRIPRRSTTPKRPS